MNNIYFIFIYTFFSLLCFPNFIFTQNILYVSSSSNFTITSCNNTCGLTESCACFTIQDAIDLIPEQTEEQYDIMVLPGEYSGVGNVNISLDERPISVQSTNGSTSTIVFCNQGETGFKFDSSNIPGSESSLIGFTIQSCQVIVTNSSIASFNDIKFFGSIEPFEGNFIEITNNSTSSFVDCNFSSFVTKNQENSPISVSISSNSSFISCLFEKNTAITSKIISVHGDENSFSEMNIINCTFINNTGFHSIKSYASGLSIFNSIFSNNTGYMAIIFTIDSNVIISQTTWEYSSGSPISVSGSTNKPCSLGIDGSSFKYSNAILSGGAISADRCSFQIINCDFINNNAPAGGAISIQSPQNLVNGGISESTIINCKFIGNTANPSRRSERGNDEISGGGAILVSGSQLFSLNVSESTFENNIAAKGTGGAIHTKNIGDINSNLQLSNNIFIKNYALTGGAIYSSFNITTEACRFDFNSANKHGGAIALMGGTSFINNSNFTSNNVTQFGGGIFIKSTVVGVIEYIYLYNNTALNGGGIFLEQNSTINIVSSYFENNQAVVMGGGLSIQEDVHNNGHLEYYNPILENIKEEVEEEEKENINIQYCYFNNNSALKGGGLAITGPTKPQISNSTFINNFGTLGGGIFIADDIGAHFINNSITQNRGNYGAGIAIFGTSGCFFELINISKNSANFDGGGVSIGEFSIPTFILCTFDENTAVAQSAGCAISGSSSPTFLFCNFTRNSAPRAGGVFTSQKAHPTFDTCYFNNNMVSNFGAAGMFIDNSYPNLTNCEFKENHAEGEGGALIIVGSSKPLISGCIFLENFGYHGGAIDISTNTTFTITDCTFQGNFAKTRGGGIRISGSSSVIISSCDFTNNAAVNGAGLAIYDDSSPKILSSHISKNFALIQGGGVLIADWSVAYFYDCKIDNNFVQTGSGGGIAISDYANPVFNKSKILYNNAPHGAGIYSISGGNSSILYNTEISFNNASTDGGGLSIHGYSKIKVELCIFNFNEAYGFGGGCNTEDTAVPEFLNTIFSNNYAHRSGGALSVQGASTPKIEGCTLRRNIAVRGGGIFYSTIKARGDLITSTIIDNYAFAGGGLFMGSFTELSVSNSNILNNLALLFGGGIAKESITNSIFSNCTISYNRAVTGGGIYIFPIDNGLPSDFSYSYFQPNEYNQQNILYDINDNVFNYSIFKDNSYIIELSSSGNYENIINENENEDDNDNDNDNDSGNVFIANSFQNSTVSNNVAFSGGGIVLYDTLGDQSLLFDNHCSISYNWAFTYGGGIFFSSLTTTLKNPIFFGSSFISNNANYGGGSAGWRYIGSDLIGSERVFCSNCSFQNNTGGYQTVNGFATPPINVSFVSDYTCPGSLYLDADSFRVGIHLLDKFGTQVKGKLLLDSTFNTTVSCEEASCLLQPKEVTLRIPEDGTLTFSNLLLNGKNNASCTLIFATTDYNPNENHYHFQNINCNITLSGCPSDQVVSAGESYDMCENANFWQANKLYFLFFIITGLVMLLILLVSLQVTLWYRKKRKANWGKSISVPNFVSGKPSISLEDILNDPNIPHIPWEQIEVGKKLGVGAAAIVRQGLWISDGGKGSAVALKQLLLPTQQITSDLLKDFLIEIKLTSALHHENVVRLIGVSCSPDLDLHLVTELMDRGSIRDVLDAKGFNLGWDLRLKLLCDAAKGMAYLHSRNVIHRDLKPRNLLVSRDWICKVADFGASTIQVQANKTMTVIGTPAYMAPEVLAHTKYSEKADVYSFGIIIVEVYTNEAPYSGPEFDEIRNQVQLISRIVNDNLQPNIDTLPSSLAHLVEDCWNEEPALRPSFSEIVIRLRRLRKLEYKIFKKEDTNNNNDDDNNNNEEYNNDDSIIPIEEEKGIPILEKSESLILINPTDINAQILLLGSNEEAELEKEALSRSQSNLSSLLIKNEVKKKKKQKRLSESSVTSENTPLLIEKHKKDIKYNTTTIN